MKQPQITKTFDEIQCPHCQGTVHVGIQIMIPLLTYSTPEQLKTAREELQKRLESIKFKSPAMKEEVNKWLENTPVETSDIEGVIRSILINYGEEPIKQTLPDSDKDE